MSLIQPETTALQTGSALDRRAAAGHPRSESTLEWLLDGRGFLVLQLVSDAIALLVAIAIAAGGPLAAFESDHAALLVMPPAAMALFALRGLYSRRIYRAILDGVAPVVGSITIAAMAVVVVDLYVAHGPGDGQDAVVAWVAALACVGAGRVSLVLLQRWARARMIIGRPTLIVGAGLVGTQIARRLLTDPHYGLRPVGFLEGPDMATIGEPEARTLPVLGDFSELQAAAERSGARHVIIAFSGAARDAELVPLVRECEELGLEASLVPRMFESLNDRLAYETLGGLPLLGLRTVDPKGWQFAIKHALDRVGALLLLICSAPLLALIAIAIKVETRGPILFRQRRVGRDGQVFDLLKFCSMRSAEPGDAFEPSADSAPGGVEGVDRRTRIGRFLRRTSLDELPQLVNVLRGEMSLVGPRPERPMFVELFGRNVRRYGERHRVRSGLTGWAQVHGFRGQTSLSDRVEWDNYYIEHWSLALDFKILLLTVVALFRHAE